MNQPSLDFDLVQGREDRERGLRRVSRKRPETMTRLAVHLLELAQRMPFLTSDDLRNAVPREDWPNHPNTWGAAMTNGAKAGLLAESGSMDHSAIRTNRARRVIVWRSLVYRQQGVA